ncbi:hypothetical protein [Halocola ammonii]
MKIDQQIIDDLCEEIEIQWNCHVMTRAVFYSKFPEKNEFTSPTFHRDAGIAFRVKILKPNTNEFQKSAHRVAVWLNQNYIIRLYGILDGKQLIKYGKLHHIKVFQLVRLMRNNIGAHSSGKKVSAKRRGELRKATKLINELTDRNISLNEVSNYTLSIDSVLKPIKDQVCEEIRKLQGKQIEFKSSLKDQRKKIKKEVQIFMKMLLQKQKPT